MEILRTPSALVQALRGLGAIPGLSSQKPDVVRKMDGRDFYSLSIALVREALQSQVVLLEGERPALSLAGGCFPKS